MVVTVTKTTYRVTYGDESFPVERPPQDYFVRPDGRTESAMRRGSERGGKPWRGRSQTRVEGGCERTVLSSLSFFSIRNDSRVTHGPGPDSESEHDSLHWESYVVTDHYETLRIYLPYSFGLLTRRIRVYLDVKY